MLHSQKKVQKASCKKSPQSINPESNSENSIIFNFWYVKRLQQTRKHCDINEKNKFSTQFHQKQIQKIFSNFKTPNILKYWKFLIPPTRSGRCCWRCRRCRRCRSRSFSNCRVTERGRMQAWLHNRNALLYNPSESFVLEQAAQTAWAQWRQWWRRFKKVNFWWQCVHCLGGPCSPSSASQTHART